MALNALATPFTGVVRQTSIELPSSSPAKQLLSPAKDVLHLKSEIDRSSLSTAKSPPRLTRRISNFSTASDCMEDIPEIMTNSNQDDTVDGRTSRSDSTGQGKDSGIECFEDFAPPDQELIDKIVVQIESYFSDCNLEKDAFLLKHIRRNPDGYVSLKLVSSFRKVKALTKNWKVVAFSIMNGSKKLSINDQLTKVKRIEVLPESVLGARVKSRTLIAYNIPSENPSIAFISQQFGQFGEVSLVKLFRAGATSNYSHLLKKATDFNGNGFALVEYETADEAENAIDKVDALSGDNWRNGMRAFLVEESKAKEEVKRPLSKSRSHTFCEQPSSAPSRTRSFYGDARRPRSQTTVTFAKEDQKPDFHRAKERANFTFQRKKSNSVSDSLVRNHNRFASLSNKENNSSQPNEPKSEALIRQPKGPDGTKGFLNRVPLRKDRSTSLPFPFK